MFPSSTSFTAISGQENPTLRRESTDEISKMYTTLYDNEDPQQQQEYLQQKQLQGDDVDFINALLGSPTWNEFGIQSPASPTSSCFSGCSSPTSSSGSAHSSPATGLIKMMDADEADELVDLFNITIDDLLAGNPLAFQGDVDPLNLAATNLALFAPSQPQQNLETAALHFDNNSMTSQEQDYFQMQYQQQVQQHQEQQKQHYQLLHSQSSSTNGSSSRPQRSGSLSPVTSSTPYPMRKNRFTPETCQSPEHPYFDSMPSSPIATYTSPYSLSPAPLTPCMSPIKEQRSFETNVAASAAQTSPVALPRTEGMTVIRSEDGSIMVYNPITESMTFRCELCPRESFGRIHDLKRHQASKHQEKIWPCEYCNRPFVRRDALLRHYTVKAARDDGLHPASHETDKLMAARARAKLI
ncbi:hypothetical protein BG011_009080 [Mortierella polycephala]|uniref:C2H2-type domain-containing protein n=1 Tax=Mortierella polycephala TaxID=41804 RepID=A0A9P6QCI9_9FUNG|nr:hypothetical protein BG011_009080 [Mortierella polycephala]